MEHTLISTHKPTTFTPVRRGILQRACACGQHSGNGGECESCRKRREGMLQRAVVQPSALDTQLGDPPPVVHDVLRSPGQPLDVQTRAFMEPRFGHDFSSVRVHTDAKAAESARAVNALAYTVGRDVVFGVGQYAPQSYAGRRLMAHELTHVAQQCGHSQTLQEQDWLGNGDSPHEYEAVRVAEQVVDEGKISRPALMSTGMLQRTMICSKRLEAPGIGLFANHSYIDDTGRDDCLGTGMARNYAVTDLVSGNFVRGCATKTDHSADPRGRTPNRKPCRPKAGVTDLSRCLRDAYNSYADPSVYSNEAVAIGAGAGAAVGGAGGGVVGGVVGGIAGALGGAYLGARLASGINGPNSNTFAATLANACCDDSSSSGLGWVPGWDHAPAATCSGSMPLDDPSALFGRLDYEVYRLYGVP